MPWPTLHIFLLLVSTLALGSPSEVSSNCPEYKDFYCTCFENDVVEVKSVKMCTYPKMPRPNCYPCSTIYQDLMNCTIHEYGYPMCHILKFMPEESREVLHTVLRDYPKSTNIDSTYFMPAKFFYGGDIINNTLVNVINDDAGLNASHPPYIRLSKLVTVNSNEILNYSKDIKGENFERKTVTGKKGILSNTSADKDFAIPRKDAIAKIRTEEDVKNPIKNFQLSYIEELGILSHENPSFMVYLDDDEHKASQNVRQPLKTVYFPNSPASSTYAFFKNISLLTANLRSDDEVQKLEANDATLNTSYPQSRRSGALMAVNSNTNLKYSNKIKSENSDQETVSGNKSILSNTSADKDFGIPRKDAIAKTRIEEDLKNQIQNIQFISIEELGILKHGFPRFREYLNGNEPNANKNVSNVQPLKTVHFHNSSSFDTYMFFKNISLLIANLQNDDQVQKLRKQPSSGKVYPFHPVTVEPEIKTEESRRNGTGFKKGMSKKVIILLPIKSKEDPRFDFQINRNQENHIRGKRYRRKEENESSKGIENPPGVINNFKNMTINETGVHRSISLSPRGDIRKTVYNNTSNRINFQAEDLIEVKFRSDFKDLESKNIEKDLDENSFSGSSLWQKDGSRNNDGNYQAESLGVAGNSKDFISLRNGAYERNDLKNIPLSEKDLNSTKNASNIQLEMNAEMNSQISQDAGVTSDSENLPVEKKSSVDEKGSNVKLNVERFKGGDENVLRESSGIKVFHEDFVDTSHKTLHSDSDDSRNSEKSSHGDVVDITSRPLQSDTKASRSSEKSPPSDGDDLSPNILQFDADSSKNSEKSLPEGVVDMSSRAIQSVPDTTRNPEKSIEAFAMSDPRNPLVAGKDAIPPRNAENSQEYLDTNGNVGGNVFGDINTPYNSGKLVAEAYRRIVNSGKDSVNASLDARNNLEVKHIFPFLKEIGLPFSWNDSKTFIVITSEPKAETNSAANPDNASISMSGNINKTYSPILHKESEAVDQKFINVTNYTTTVDPYIVKPNHTSRQNEEEPNVWDSYKAASESQNKTVKNETMVRIKRSLQLNDSAEGKVLAHFSVNDSDVRSRTKRSTSPHNSWCCIKKMIRNGNLDCTIWTYKKECSLCCLSGYAFEGNKKMKFRCDRQSNKWEPNLSQPCTPAEGPEQPGGPDKPYPLEDVETYAEEYYPDLGENNVDYEDNDARQDDYSYDDVTVDDTFNESINPDKIDDSDNEAYRAAAYDDNLEDGDYEEYDDYYDSEKRKKRRS